MRGWQPSHVSRMSIGMKLEPQHPRPRHDHHDRSWTTPDRLVMTESLPSTASVKLYTAGTWVTWLVTTRKSILCYSQVTRESLFKLLCPSCVTRQKLPLLINFKSNVWLTYVHAEWHTSPRVTYDQCVWGLRPTHIRASPEWVTREKFPDRFEPFHTVGELVPSDGESPELLRMFRTFWQVTYEEPKILPTNSWWNAILTNFCS